MAGEVNGAVAREQLLSRNSLSYLAGNSHIDAENPMENATT